MRMKDTLGMMVQVGTHRPGHMQGLRVTKNLLCQVPVTPQNEEAGRKKRGQKLKAEDG